MPNYPDGLLLNRRFERKPSFWWTEKKICAIIVRNIHKKGAITLSSWKNRNKGFTLVELIVVIAILGVLMAVLIPQYIQYVEKSRKGVCNFNCAAVEREIHIAQMVADGNFGDPAAQAILDSHEGKVCPSDGTVRMELNSETNYYVINCSKHGAHPNQPATDTYYKYEDVYKKWKELGIKFESNNEFRKYYIENRTKTPGKWDEIVVKGKIYYMQPYIDAHNTGFHDPSKDLYVFANINSTASGNWNANLIYNHEDKQWYEPPSVNQAIGFTDKSWAWVKQEMAAKKWKPVEVTYK